MKVISGGQNGVDQAGLFAAEKLGIETGGWLPRNCKTLDGPRYDLRDRFNMQVHRSYNYADRTEDNVLAGDATIRIAENLGSPGEKCTLNAINAHSKPHFAVKVTRIGDILSAQITPQQVVDWLMNNKVQVLNIAGNSEHTSPGIFSFSQQYLTEVFQLWLMATKQ